MIIINFETIIIKRLPVRDLYGEVYENVPDENPGENVDQRVKLYRYTYWLYFC